MYTSTFTKFEKQRFILLKIVEKKLKFNGIKNTNIDFKESAQQGVLYKNIYEKNFNSGKSVGGATPYRTLDEVKYSSLF